MSRKKAFFLHFCLSFLIVSTCMVVVLVIWYPGFYFQIFATGEVLKVLIFVDLILGPLLTLLLFKPGKPGLRFDLAVIATIQLSALIFGLHVIYQERPYFTVFAVDRFEVLAKRDVDISQVAPEFLRAKSWFGPLFVVAVLPEDWSERQRLMEETLFEGKPDIQQRPGLWRPYQSGVAEVFQKARPVGELLRHYPEAEIEIRALAKNTGNVDSLVYLPISGKQHVFTLVLDPSTGEPLGLINQDPWLLPENRHNLSRQPAEKPQEPG